MRVFCSSSLIPDHPLVTATENLNISLIQQPMISYESVANTPLQPFDIIFFSSPRSYHFGKSLIKPNTLIACVSTGTKKHITEPVAWQGQTPGNPKTTALEFHQWVGKKRVLFPVSDLSLGQIPQVFSQDQIEVVIRYKTLLTPCTVIPCDVYVFTSPSNVTSFLQLNEIPQKAKVVAWGDSTSAALESHGISPNINQTTENSIPWPEILNSWANP